MWVEIKEKKKIGNNKYIEIFLRLVSKEDRKCHWVQARRTEMALMKFDIILEYFGWQHSFSFSRKYATDQSLRKKEPSSN